jgi:2-C-methyl-D-erythritol 4-phosphate cytidylyltransferase
MLRYAIIVAGGTGQRMGSSIPKQFLKLGNGVPILVQTFRVFAALPSVQIVVVLPQEHLDMWENLRVSFDIPAHDVVAGGATRTDSVAKGMALVPDDGLVAIHDGVRPFVSEELIECCYQVAAKKWAACAAVPSKDSLRRLSPDGSSVAVSREEYYLVQTPQTFRALLWKEALAAAKPGQVFTDDASLVEAAGYAITLVEGSYANIKITTPDDLPRIENEAS